MQWIVNQHSFHYIFVIYEFDIFLIFITKNVNGRHFSHVTKSRIFKNLNLREKADRNFRHAFLKNRFRHVKLYSNLPSWLVRACCHIGTFWKTKDWSLHFSEGQHFRCWLNITHFGWNNISEQTNIWIGYRTFPLLIRMFGKFWKGRFSFFNKCRILSEILN